MPSFIDEVTNAVYEKFVFLNIPMEESDKEAIQSTSLYLLEEIEQSIHKEFNYKYKYLFTQLVFCEYLLLTELLPSMEEEKEITSLRLGDATITYNPKKQEMFFSELKKKAREIRQLLISSLRQVIW